MEEKKIKLEVTQKELEVIISGVLEIPAKYSLSVVQNLQRQIQSQLSEPIKDEITTSEDKPKD